MLSHSQEKPVRRGDRRWFNDKLKSIESLAGADARQHAVNLWASIVHRDSIEAEFAGADALDKLHNEHRDRAREVRYLSVVPFSLSLGVEKKYRDGGCDLEWLGGIANRIAMPPILTGLDIDAENSDIRAHGKKLAALCLALPPAAALGMAEHKLDKPVTGKTIESKQERIICHRYWTKQVRKTLRQHREMCHIKLAPARINYCSIDAEREYKSMLDSIAKWAAEHEFVSNTGDKFQAPAPEKTQKNRYAQLVAQTKGIADSATSKGYVARIITPTLDTEYHPTTSYARPGAKNPKKDRIRVRNKKYKELTPREGQDWLQGQWVKCRSAIKNRGIDIEFVIGVHPTGDETPHWHIVMFNDPLESEIIDALIEKYFRTNDLPEQIDYEPCDSIAGACAYAIRMALYSTRQVSANGKGTEEDKIEAHNASAWASTWGIRRYRTSNCRATLWRWSRKDDIDVPADMKAAAKAGKYFEFTKCVEKYKAKIAYAEKTNSYGESYRVPKGVRYVLNGNPCASVSSKTWTLARVGTGQTYTYYKEPSKPQTTQPTPETDRETDIETELEGVLGLDFRSQHPPPCPQPQNFQTLH